MSKRVSNKYFQDGRARAGLRYALVPVDVMESEAFHSIPDYARCVLFAIAAKFRSANNGDLSLTAGEAKRLGVFPEWRLRAGIEILDAVGLIEITRRGHLQNGRGTCNLYALGYREVNPSEKYDHGWRSTIVRQASNRWADWKRPDDWDGNLERIRRKAQGKSKPSSSALPPWVAQEKCPTSHAEVPAASPK